MARVRQTPQQRAGVRLAAGVGENNDDVRRQLLLGECHRARLALGGKVFHIGVKHEHAQCGTGRQFFHAGDDGIGHVAVVPIESVVFVHTDAVKACRRFHLLRGDFCDERFDLAAYRHRIRLELSMEVRTTSLILGLDLLHGANGAAQDGHWRRQMRAWLEAQSDGIVVLAVFIYDIVVQHHLLPQAEHRSTEDLQIGSGGLHDAVLVLQLDAAQIIKDMDGGEGTGLAGGLGRVGGGVDIENSEKAEDGDLGLHVFLMD